MYSWAWVIRDRATPTIAHVFQSACEGTYRDLRMDDEHHMASV